MYNKKKKLKLFLILVFAVFLIVGCSMQGSISISIDPNPIVFTFDKQVENATIEVTTKGFGEILINDVSISVLDGDTELYSDTTEVNEKIGFSVPGVKVEEPFTLDFKEFYSTEITENYYSNNLEGEEIILKIIVTGNETTTAEVPIQFQ